MAPVPQARCTRREVQCIAGVASLVRSFHSHPPLAQGIKRQVPCLERGGMGRRKGTAGVGATTPTVTGLAQERAGPSEACPQVCIGRGGGTPLQGAQPLSP